MGSAVQIAEGSEQMKLDKGDLRSRRVMQWVRDLVWDVAVCTEGSE